MSLLSAGYLPSPRKERNMSLSQNSESESENAIHETNSQRGKTSHFTFYSKGYVLEMFLSNICIK